MGDQSQLKTSDLPPHAAPKAQWVALVVEDDDDQRDLIGAILEESEVKVIACDSAEEAVQVMEKIGDNAVFVLTDVDLAGDMDGVDLACELRSRWPHTRVVTTSGGCDRSRLAHLPRQSRHLEKPWRALDIIIELERAIAAH
jgi:DNA-binding NtrC family response regulator